MNRLTVSLRYFLLLLLALLGSTTVLAFAYLLQQDAAAPAVDGRALALEGPQPAFRQRFTSITIHDSTGMQLLQANARTVADALDQAGITLSALDSVEPALDTAVAPEMHIYVHRAIPLTVNVDGQLLQLRSSHRNALNVLMEAGIVLHRNDFTRPGPEAVLQPGGIIEIVRVSEEFVEEDEPLPYETEWQPSDQFEIDTEGLLQPGVPGALRRRWRVRLENGVPVDRVLENEWVVQEPQPEIMGFGTDIVLRLLDTPDGIYQYWRHVRMRVTSYTASSSGKPPDHPAYGITASGLEAGTGIVAVDRNVVPFRSWVYVPGYGIGFAGDTGGGVLGRWIDLGYDEDEFVGWSGYVDVYYLTPVPEVGTINFRLPAELP